MNCPYCMSPDVPVTDAGAVHKVDPSFGPFDLGACRLCGSMCTINPPTRERIAEFYTNYDMYRPDWYKAGANSGALAMQYEFYARHVARQAEGGQWLDVGCGHGEVSNSLCRLGMKGVAIDIGPRPNTLAPEVEYQSVDMNTEHWSSRVNGRFTNVFSIAVWEHVLEPATFAKECLELVSPGGRLTLVAPDYSSLARRTLNQFWPYYEPGEHISIPSKKGAALCLHRAAAELDIKVGISVSRLNVSYSLRYLLNVLRLNRLASAIPPNAALPLPTGILSASVTRL